MEFTLVLEKNVYLESFPGILRGSLFTGIGQLI